MVFVDTNILIYAAIEQDLAKKERSIALLEQCINETVFFVGHGIFNRLIHKELLALGWLTKEKPATAYWQFSSYFPP